MMILVTVALALIIIIKDIVPAVKEKFPVKDIVVMSIVAGFAILITLLHSLEINLPSPLQATETFLSKVVGLTY